MCRWKILGSDIYGAVNVGKFILKENFETGFNIQGSKECMAHKKNCLNLDLFKKCLRTIVDIKSVKF